MAVSRPRLSLPLIGVRVALASTSAILKNKMKISPARVAAFDILTKIEREKAFSSAVLPLFEKELAPKDRALCHALALGVLRKKIYLDRIINKFTKNKKLDPAVRTALQLGLFQMLFLDKIPDYSAISESVNLVQRAKKTSAKGLVNAVLRRATREKIVFEYADEIEKIAIETSFPRWLIERWTKEFGIEETAKLAKANNETPPLVFRLTNKANDKTLEILRKVGAKFSESKIVENAWRVEKPNEMLFAFADEGAIYFQDEGSQLVGKTVDLQKGERFLDVCAAPASKLSQIAGESSPNENFIVGGDLYFHRLEVAREITEKTGAKNVNIAAYDALDPLPFAPESFDVALVDAPCSGTGTIRHNPEIRYFLSQNDFAELSDKQLRILINASKALKSGGRLIYSTCSLEIEENEAVCERFLSANPNFKQVLPQSARKFLTESGFARTFPQRDETDGFFIAAFQKN